MRKIRFSNRFKRDYKREKTGRHSKTLDATLMGIVKMLAADVPLPHNNFDFVYTRRETSDLIRRN